MAKSCRNISKLCMKFATTNAWGCHPPTPNCNIWTAQRTASHRTRRRRLSKQRTNYFGSGLMIPLRTRLIFYIPFHVSLSVTLCSTISVLRVVNFRVGRTTRSSLKWACWSAASLRSLRIIQCTSSCSSTRMRSRRDREMRRTTATSDATPNARYS